MSSTSSLDYDYLFKILVIGDSGVGKSALMLRFTEDTFTTSHISTIGVDFRIRTVDLDDSKVAKLQIWDTAGQERFRTITKSYYRGCDGVIIVYDVTDSNSFRSVEHWIGEVGRTLNPKHGVKMLLVGNKADLRSSSLQVVSTEAGEQLAKQFGLGFVETSARMSYGVEEAFLLLAHDLKREMPPHRDTLRKVAVGSSTSSRSIRVGPSTADSSGQRSCCFH